MRLFAGLMAVSFVLSPIAALAEQQAAPAATLVRDFKLPYAQFTLPNGLRVIVHEDRKAPIVAVAAWYNVGSKDEPPGKTGFAHLFEHIMLFNGTENTPNGLMEPLRSMGATDWNGTTWFDRTNYFQTVPTPALEQTLFMESDRMGHLLGALTQERLDNQRGVVQNEKRQNDNNPFGLVQYAQLEALFPEGHPYRHSTIGSMADLDSASLEDVRQWFRENYGPNNAVLVLAGDIDLATARTLVEKYFGHIPRGPQNVPASAAVPTLPAPVSATMTDRVANTRLYRSWAVPGLTDKDLAALDAAGEILGGLASSRLDNELVRKDQTAVGVSAGILPFQRVGMFTATVDVKPGADADAVSRRLDAIIAEFLDKGPTADEVSRVATTAIAQRLYALEQVGGFGGKAVVLAEGTLYADDPAFTEKQLAAYAALTPASVRDAARRWLSRPVWSLRVDPGARPPYQEAAVTRPAPKPAEPIAKTPRGPMPPVGDIAGLDFPTLERATLKNGMRVTYARRAAAPVTYMAADFDAGVAADPKDKLGAQRLALRVLAEGTTSRNALQLAEAKERLGANIFTNASLDQTAVILATPSANLAPAVELFANVVRNPAFAAAEVQRLRAQQVADIASEKTQPVGLAQRALPPLIYGEGHPYGRPFSGIGDVEVVGAMTREDLAGFHSRWIRPDNGQVFVVSDRPLGEILPLLEARFGDWRAPATPRGAKTFTAAIPPATPRIVLIDRPQSPQSLILAGAVLPVKGTDDPVTLNAANEVLGNNFLSRINTDIRERKGWSYGLRGYLNMAQHDVPYLIQAPVQADKTGDSIKALIANYRAFESDQGVTAAERERTVNGNTRQLAGSFETSNAVLGALRGLSLYGRPDDYWETIAARYRAMTAADMDKAARAAIDISDFTWVVVGDAASVRPQLEGLGLPVEVQPAS